MTAPRILIVIGVMLAAAAVIAAVYFGGMPPSALSFDISRFDGMKEVLVSDTSSLMLFWLGLGYFWLALGFFDHGRSIRENAATLQKVSQDAAAALELVTVEAHRQQHYHRARLRAAQPRWQVNGCVAYKTQCEIGLRNVGAAASNLGVWKKDLPAAVMLSNAVFIDRGQDLTIKVMFTSESLDNFDLRLEYSDAAGDPRSAEIKVVDAAATVEHEEF
jgi:hypothetical protein